MTCGARARTPGCTHRHVCARVLCMCKHARACARECIHTHHGPCALPAQLCAHACALLMIGALLAPQEPWLEELYSKISRELDLAARIRSLNRKLDYAHQVCDGVCACVCCIVGALRAGCWCALAGLRVDGVGVFQCDLILSPLDCMDDVSARECVDVCIHTQAHTKTRAHTRYVCVCMYLCVYLRGWRGRWWMY